MSYIDTIKKHNFNFSKKFGQNFIFDTNLLQAICNDAEINKNTTVVEIGAGSGSLTNVIATNAKKVFSFEIDNNLKPVLQETLQNAQNVSLRFEDILKVNTKQLETEIKDNYTIVANLPYYITTPIIFKFVDEAQNLNKMVIMVQKEVAERLVAKQGTKDYGLITVTLDAIADIKITRIVNRKMFTPAPNVDSAIVSITFNKQKHNIPNYELFKKVVKSAFAMRRKTLSNNLKNSFNLNTEQIDKILTTMGLNPSVRGETLGVEQFVALANQIQTYL